MIKNIKEKGVLSITIKPFVFLSMCMLSLLFSLSSRGQLITRQVENHVLAKDIVANTTTIKVLDPVDITLYSEYNYSVLVKLIYGKEARKDVVASTVSTATAGLTTYGLNYTLQFIDQSGNVNPTLETGNGLQIQYQPNLVSASTTESYQLINVPAGAWKGVIFKAGSLITPISADIATSNDVRVEVYLICNYRMLPDIGTFRGALQYNTTTKELNWPYQVGASYYQLEWVHIDSESSLFNAGLTPEQYFNAKEPVRVSLANQYYRFDPKYSKGKVYVRVRAVWTYGGINNTQEHVGTWTNLTTNFLSVSSSIEDAKNWQRISQFAEEGKSGQAVSYLDGTFRNRQNVSLINSENASFVSEVKYDFEGRPVIGILPYPVSGMALNYLAGQNLFTTAVNDGDKKVYDNLYITSNAPVLSSAKGAENYYSSANTTTQAARDFIPSANGFSYAQIQYLQDGTGRVSRKSKPGDAFNLKNTEGHFTSNFYGQASGYELYRMFGKNVGTASHYEKHYNIDANGQATVAYADQFSRVVATALVGNTPTVTINGTATDILLADEDNLTPASITIPLLGQNRFDAAKSAYISTSSQVNIIPNTTYVLKYDLTGLLDGTSPGFQTCKACTYDLEITITDPSGLPVLQSSGLPMVYLNLGPSSFTCPAVGLDGTYTLNNVMNQSFVFSKVGEYRITKTLTLSRTAQDVLFTELKASPLAPQLSAIEADYISRINNAACDITCEDKALSANPTWDPLSPSYIIGTYTNQINDWINDNCSAKPYMDEVQSDQCFSILTTIKSDCDENQTCINNSGVTDYKLHPEYCHYDACVRETASRQFDLDLTFITDWDEGSTPKNYVGNMVGLDPIFIEPEFGNLNYPIFQTAKKALVDRINAYYVENASANPPKIITNDGINQTFTLQQYVALPEVHGGAVVWDALSSEEQSQKKWQMYQAVYSALKQKMLSDIKSSTTGNPWKCAYQPNETAIVPAPFYSEDNTVLQNKSALDAQDDCDGLCDLNAQLWLDNLTSQGCPSLTATEKTLVLGFLKNYCVANCGLSNPFALLLAKHITEARAGLYISTKPGYRDLAQAIQILDAKGCDLLNTSYNDPYTYGNAITVTPTNTYKLKQSAYDLIKAVNALLAEARSPKNILYTCPDETSDLFVNKAYTKTTSSNSYHYQYNVITKDIFYSPDMFRFLAIIDDRILKFPFQLPTDETISNAYAFKVVSQSSTINTYNNLHEYCTPSIGQCTYFGRDKFGTTNNNESAVFVSAISASYFFLTYNPSTGYTKILKNKIFSISNPRYKTMPQYTNPAGFITNTIDFIELDAVLLDQNGKQYNSVIYLPNMHSNLIPPSIIMPAPCVSNSPTSSGIYYLDLLSPATTYTVTPVTGIQKCEDNQTQPATGPKTFCEVQMPISDRAVCRKQLLDDAKDLAALEYEKQMQLFYESYLTQHLKSCLSNKVKETFTLTFASKEYHYTLYYYDQAGNLVRTVPPEGVRLLTASSFDANGIYNGVDMPPHILTSTYKYNSLRQFTNQVTPDAGTVNYYYNSKGQFRLSQNAQQNFTSTATVNKYSYYKYDALGRIVEVGELQNYSKTASYMTNSGNRKAVLAVLDDLNFPNSTYQLTDITQTIYDVGDIATQTNLRGRVATSQTANSNAVGSPLVTRTNYSYDISGNIHKIMQEAVLGKVQTICYSYDLISGLTKKVSYQGGKADQMAHKYYYDAENRLKNVYTSRDNGLTWHEEAEYFYYMHGPLARIEYGEKKVQGVDYVYTLQGQVKMVNTPHNPRAALALSNNQTIYSNTADIGKDGVDYSISSSTNRFVGQDEFAFALGYYQGDYAPIKATADLGITASAQEGMQSGMLAKGLYNGNITWMITQMNSLGGKMNSLEGVTSYSDNYGIRATAYKYDQLNRLRFANNFTHSGTAFVSDIRWNSEYQYDRNGNITIAKNWDESATMMDYLSYKYTMSGGRLSGKNQLLYVTDSKTTAATDDIENQDLGNYTYDKNGNLIKDNKENISNVVWNIYGKVRTVTKVDGSKMEFTYDARGNRVRKVRKNNVDVLIDETIYIRGIDGSVMATYYTQPSMTRTTIEHSLYGASRLGNSTINILKGFEQEAIPAKKVFYYTPGLTLYELANHLGNVHVVIANHKTGIDINGDGIADLYKASVVSLSDYYSFGMNIRKRSCQDVTYRYGFNGKEQDKAEWNTGAIYDYGFRIYDPRLGKFLSVDPLTSKYPYYTPYQFAGNMPIFTLDLDGLEPAAELNPQKGYYHDGNGVFIYHDGVTDLPESDRRWTWAGTDKRYISQTEGVGSKARIVTKEKYTLDRNARIKATNDRLAGYYKAAEEAKARELAAEEEAIKNSQTQTLPQQVEEKVNNNSPPVNTPSTIDEEKVTEKVVDVATIAYLVNDLFGSVNDIGDFIEILKLPSTTKFLRSLPILSDMVSLADHGTGIVDALNKGEMGSLAVNAIGLIVDLYKLSPQGMAAGKLVQVALALHGAADMIFSAVKFYEGWDEMMGHW